MSARAGTHRTRGQHPESCAPGHPFELADAVSRFGADATRRLSALGAKGEPEDQIRAPLEGLIDDLADLCGIGRRNVTAVGESSMADLRTRPDFAVESRGALVGFIEVKAPGKGADPRRYHDRPASGSRLPPEQAPMVTGDGALPTAAGSMPDVLEHDAARKWLRVGAGFVENVTQAMCDYEVSGMRVLNWWFSGERPRPPGRLSGQALQVGGGRRDHGAPLRLTRLGTLTPGR